jgi:hypothetical protein
MAAAPPRQRVLRCAVAQQNAHLKQREFSIRHRRDAAAVMVGAA